LLLFIKEKKDKKNSLSPSTSRQSGKTYRDRHGQKCGLAMTDEMYLFGRYEIKHGDLPVRPELVEGR
jgi:hypothetical protein